MAGFQTHITVSTALGAGMTWWGHEHYGLGWSTCAVAGGLCAIGGMMPDLDSDSGVPARETISFAAAVVPMLLFNRLRNQYGLDVEHMILFGAPIYLFIRFGLGTLLKLFTIHRGMFHSIPACVIAGMIAYLICDSGMSLMRIFKGSGLALGYLSHLVLDEIWSIEIRGVTTRVKRSFGTALKLFGDNAAANSLCYGMLIAVGLAVVQEKPSPAPVIANPVAPPVRVVPSSDFTEPPPLQPPRTVIAPPDQRRPAYQARTHRFDLEQN